MNNNFENDIDSLAESIKIFAGRLKVDAFYTLIEVSDLVKKYAEIYTSQKPTSISGYNVLSAIVLNGSKLTATEISKQVFRSRYTVTRLIDTLEKQGLVERRLTKTDRRIKHVYITKKGVKLIEKASVDMKEAVINIAFEPLSPDSVQQLNDSLKMLKGHLIHLISQNKQYSHYELPVRSKDNNSSSKLKGAKHLKQVLTLSNK
jgi:DNA-binding MarR family transcriptional regulator